MIIVILGPTGVGKTKLSLELAKNLNGEIINADSTQVYKGLDIATSKINDLEGIPHHLMDIKEFEEDYTVYDYQKDARDVIKEILSRHKLPIMVGGTGLYIKAALYNYEFSQNGKKDYSIYSNEELLNMVKKIDHNTDIHPNNRKRLESFLNSGNHQKSDKLLYNAIFIGLTTERKELYKRIDSRVDEMVNLGLINEAKELYLSGIRTKAIMTPIGYKELFKYFDNECSLTESLNKIKQASRNYAKRQYTWFNNQMNIKWFNVSFDNFESTSQEVMDYIKKQMLILPPCDSNDIK